MTTPAPGDHVVLKSRPVTGAARVVERGQRTGLWWLRYQDGTERQHHEWEFMAQERVSEGDQASGHAKP